jgi:Sulfotransferase family
MRGTAVPLDAPQMEGAVHCDGFTCQAAGPRVSSGVSLVWSIMSAIPVLYITAFPFSGSTLLSFLLNDHEEITTVGHMMGWPAATEDFPCSCGEKLRECPFYAAMKHAFHAEGLTFDVNNFGTAYSLAGSDRLNRALTEALPFLDSNALEIARDGLVRSLGPFRRKLQLADRANRLFVEKALELNRASVFVDNSHTPYRFRHLSRVAGLDLRNIHLVRDPRGAVLSYMTHHSGSGVELATRLWLRQYIRIQRVVPESGSSMRIWYEDLCSEPNRTLAAVHRFAGLEPQPFSGDFKGRPHHILGNQMRLRSGDIRLDERWRRDMADSDKRFVEQEVSRAARRHASLAGVVDRYLG